MAGPACRLDHGGPAVVECGLCPIRPLCPVRRLSWLRRLPGLRAANTRLRELLAERDGLIADLRAQVAEVGELREQIRDPEGLFTTVFTTRRMKTALPGTPGRPFCLVAGAGFEPATSGL